MQNRKNLRRLSLLVSAQTVWNLEKLARMSGYGDNLGKVVDKLVREKMILMKGNQDV